ncbi:MAG: riboflavin biosynthesis protein RibF [Planctomycetaceae bacterium]|nr:riboflavin biosynthesis protein RibF [Planctomycetaceae bacterium]
MQRFNSFNEIPDTFVSGALTIGKFDAVHLGHAAIFGRAVDVAHKQGQPAVVVTFDPPPFQVVAKPETSVPPVCTLSRKLELIANEGIDVVVVVPATKQLLAMDAVDFFERIIVKRFKTKVLLEGETFTFGHSRMGNPALLKKLCPPADVTLEIVPPVCVDNKQISSSELRKMIADGKIEETAKRMTKPYRITGVVEQGEQRGRTLGFPTANLGEIETILPKQGIYAAVTEIEGKQYPIALHIGTNPTFGVNQKKVEAHIINFSGNLYNKTISMDLVSHIREMIKFKTAEELIEQMKIDVKRCVEIWGHTTTGISPANGHARFS